MSATVERHSSTSNGSQHPTRRRPAVSASARALHRRPRNHPRLSNMPRATRNQYAAEAMKIGVLALRHVSGQVNTDIFRREGDQLVVGLQKTLDQHKNTVHDQIENKLKEYFDPQGRPFHRPRSAARRHRTASYRSFSKASSTAKTRCLPARWSPTSAAIAHYENSRPAAIRWTADLAQQKRRRATEPASATDLLKEFSLDNKDGCSSPADQRAHEQSRRRQQSIQTKIDVIIKEFSLNEENSALSRLVQNVTQAQRTITNEFSLDNDIFVPVEA